jgi:hypothetical protein
MRQSYLLPLTVGLLLSTMVGCAAANDPSASGASSDLSGAAAAPSTFNVSDALKRIDVLLPEGFYDGTTPKGEACSLVVQSMAAGPGVDFTLQTNSCPNCAEVGDPPLEFAVHEKIDGFDMGGSPETPLSKWTDKNGTITFNVRYDDSLKGEVDVAVSITDVNSPKASIKATIGGRTIQCDKLKVQAKMGGVE